MNHPTMITIKEVTKRTSLSRSTIWRMQRRGEFPKPVQISIGRVAYRNADVDQWIESFSAQKRN